MTMMTRAASSPRTARITAIGIVGFAAAVAAASQIAIPLPFTPVPITLQPMLVILAGMWLGPSAAAASMALYLAAGAVGLPVFTPAGAPGIARFFGATGGYLLAYPVAAYVTGVLSRHATTFILRSLAGTAGIVLIYLGGIAQLSLLYGDVGQAVALGVTPFAALDLIKAMIAAAISGPRARRSDS